MARFSFLPYASTSLASLATPPAAGNARLQVGLEVEVAANGAATAPRVSVAGSLRGPGDVLAIDRDMIARLEPREGLRGFEPTYFPFVEFRDADFPWRYAAEPADNKGRRKPWLALVALKAAEFENIGKGSGPLSRIRVHSARDSLPDLAQSWASAHVQLNLGDQTGTSATVLAGSDENSFARLFCMRQLEPNTAYFAFLVPTYATGRRAGAGEPVLATNAPSSAYLEPAWNASTSDAVVLPIYFQWRFFTDALEDLEVLLRRLRGMDADSAAEPGAARVASAALPGYYPGYSKPGAQFTVESAMRQVDTPRGAFETDEPLVDAMVQTLNEEIAGEIDDTGEDPLVTFPPYGFRFRPDDAVSKPKAKSNEWFHRINLDLKFRHAAGLGAKVVQQNQELYMHHCWQQYDAIEAANAALARAQLAKELAEKLAARHFTRLANEVSLALGEPLQPYARTQPKSSVVDTLRSNGMPQSFASRTLRRIASKRPMPSSALGGVRAIPVPRIPGDTSLSARLKAEVPFVPDAIALQRSLAQAEGRYREGVARIFTQGTMAEQVRPDAGQFAVRPQDSRALVDPLVTLALGLPKAKIKVTLDGLRATEIDAIKPIWRAPSLPFTLADALRDIDKDALLNDATRLPANTLAFFLENRDFIEAFMVGANHEMNNELRWREFPTDMRGTVFQRFWNRIAGAAIDIPEIHTWRKKLGEHFPPGDDGASNLIVVIRGDIIRKLDRAIMEINIAAGPVFKPNEGEQHRQVFTGKITPEIQYWGFDISLEKLKQAGNRAFFVIYEAIGQMRFGLDVGSVGTRAARRDLAALRPGFPVANLVQSWRPTPKGAQLLPAPLAAAPTPTDWDGLSWSHMRLTSAKYIDVTKTIAIAGKPDLWGAGKTSASLARSFWQKPLAASLALARVL